MAEITWTPFALEVLQSIYNYISKDSVTYAGRFVDKLIDKG
nr:type II toxin-antitoxin system RelE/ParE family toxin [Mucilaginibacter sp. L294]